MALEKKIRSFNKSQIPRPRVDIRIPKRFQNLDIEIGSGVGLFALQYVKKNPQRLLVSIEKTREKFRKFLKSYEEEGSPLQIVPVHTNAVWWITHFVEPESVDRYYILYPNPYPKDPQKRFFQMPFMTYLVETLKVSGQITIATNDKNYYEESKENAQKIFNLSLIEDRLVDKSEDPRTHFEKKYLERNENCYNLVFEKR